MLSQLSWLSVRLIEIIRQILYEKTKSAWGYRWTTQSSIVAVRAQQSKRISEVLSALVGYFLNWVS